MYSTYGVVESLAVHNGGVADGGAAELVGTDVTEKGWRIYYYSTDAIFLD
jgi:hypothetical protein